MLDSNRTELIKQIGFEFSGEWKYTRLSQLRKDFYLLPSNLKTLSALAEFLEEIRTTQVKIQLRRDNTPDERMQFLIERNRNIRADRGTGKSLRSIARNHGISHEMVRKICAFH